MKKIFIMAISAMLCLASASAWDGERKGFQMGIGFGGGFDSYSGIRYDSLGSGEDDHSGIAFTALPRIGFAFTNRIALYYSRHPFTYVVENESGKDVNITTCIESIHMDYYLRDSAPSLFFGLGAGVGYFMDDDTLNWSEDALKGPGVFGTIGFEPVKHITTELSVHYKSQQSGASNLGVSLIVSAIGY